MRYYDNDYYYMQVFYGKFFSPVAICTARQSEYRENTPYMCPHYGDGSTKAV
ncbi:hypothetical protein DSM106972_058440 [Dulcicalothrix desertica PCC 7102]|uniref:Uncharacterized protein n=1 Tax=Dulcicalothrix desertica PCC 7102 TaxID=232991 RepID=A0A3S1AJH8_9CYAN|nr:hypothetical protein DSM106972_058440 [Dulcicalothrix desertica PCC 7102]